MQLVLLFTMHPRPLFNLRYPGHPPKVYPNTTSANRHAKRHAPSSERKINIDFWKEEILRQFLQIASYLFRLPEPRSRIEGNFGSSFKTRGEVQVLYGVFVCLIYGAMSLLVTVG